MGSQGTAVDFRSGKVQPVALVPLFGFGDSGELRITAHTQPASASVYIVLADAEQWEESVSYLLARDVSTPICTLPTALRVEVSNVTAVRLPIPRAGRYTLQLLFCQAAEVRVTGSVELANDCDAHGCSQQLSYGEVGLLPMFATLAVVYTALAIWTRCARSLPLHKLLALGMLVKAANMLVSWLQYRQISLDGRSSDAMLVIASFFNAAGDTCFLFLLLLAAGGLSVTRSTITRREVVPYASIFGSHLLVGFVHGVCSGYAGICGASLLVAYLLRALVMLAIIVALNFNITALRQTMIFDSWSASTASLYSKLSMFHAFRWAFLAYLLLPTMLLVVEITVLSWRFAWVEQLILELVVLAVFAHLQFVFSNPQLSSFTQLADMLQQRSGSHPHALPMDDPLEGAVIPPGRRRLLADCAEDDDGMRDGGHHAFELRRLPGSSSMGPAVGRDGGSSGDDDRIASAHFVVLRE
eukprot:PLAT4941.2.p1 GENE.PLAT4941.2~~PLAT4941.2.p1  ORF type:complete len:470 (+),score=203.81 PLAT4941.2:166-1575(+)